MKQINNSMAQNFRVTAKFTPIQEQSKNQYTTQSQIQLPKHCHRIVWKRRYGDDDELLPHMDDCPTYSCSDLDADFIIEVSIETIEQQPHPDKRIMLFGPIQKVHQDPLPNKKQFPVEMVIGAKSFSCSFLIYPNELQLKSSDPKNAIEHIPMQQIGGCYVSSLTEKIIVFSTLFERKIGFKLFEHLMGGGYAKHNGPMKLRISNSNDFCSILIKLNQLKIDRYRRGSQISTHMSKKVQKPSIISTQAKKSVSDPRQDSDSSRVPTRLKTQPQLKNLKSSQLIITHKKSMIPSENQHPSSLQDESNNDYLTEFENLLNMDEQPGQVLLLNESFEELENNNGSEKDLEKLEYIKKKKQNKKSEEEKLKQKLETVRKEQTSLLQQNRRLKGQIEQMNKLNEGSKPSSKIISALQVQIRQKKAQISKYQKSQVTSSRFLTKYKSQKQL